jgi:hypothetical protein
MYIVMFLDSIYAIDANEALRPLPAVAQQHRFAHGGDCKCMSPRSDSRWFFE